MSKLNIKPIKPNIPILRYLTIKSIVQRSNDPAGPFVPAQRSYFNEILLGKAIKNYIKPGRGTSECMQ